MYFSIRILIIHLKINGKIEKGEEEKKDTKATAKDTYISINTNETKQNKTNVSNVKCILY